MPNLVILLLQAVVILLAARIVGAICRAIGQPQVVGEMIAGILLGPSLLGWAAPQPSRLLFAPDTLVPLYTLSQIGLLLFMFFIGLEFNPETLRGRQHVAVLASHTSITAPFFLGACLALILYPMLSASDVPFYQFALFMGAAMSVTAFPVLARMLHERRIHTTRMGNIAIACAAVDDVTAWCLLAYIVALVRATHGARPVWTIFAGLTLYLIVTIFVVRPLLNRVLGRMERKGGRAEDALGLVLLLLLVSALTTEWLGIHLLFGAFFFGTIMPKREAFIQYLVERLVALPSVLLLPLFFAFTGLRTSVGLIRGDMWWMFAAIMVVAVVGKLGGAAVAARLGGLRWRDAFVLGALMNTRGLMELVLLNIGLDLGVISPALFSMLVLMAIATTFMTAPMLRWLSPADAAAGWDAATADGVSRASA